MGEVGEYTVTATMQHDDEVIVTLTIDGEIIETTPWHLFYTDTGWQEAEDLSVGELVLSLNDDYGTVEAILTEDPPKPCMTSQSVRVSGLCLEIGTY
jgi:intein/homing endonuclease